MIRRSFSLLLHRLNFLTELGKFELSFLPVKIEPRGLDVFRHALLPEVFKLPAVKNQNRS